MEISFIDVPDGNLKYDNTVTEDPSSVIRLSLNVSLSDHFERRPTVPLPSTVLFIFSPSQYKSPLTLYSLSVVVAGAVSCSSRIRPFISTRSAAESLPNAVYPLPAINLTIVAPTES